MGLLFPNIPLVLGSKSPRRQFLLSEAGYSFKLRTSDIDEAFPSHLSEAEVPAFLARAKSETISIDNSECLITADTVVCLKGEIINKASNESEAKEMLMRLSGNFHLVHTGICLRQGKRQHVFTETTKVFFKELTQEEIDYYLKNFKPYDKAGAYGIQEWIGYIGVERIEGCFYNVMGFPVSRFAQELNRFIPPVLAGK